MAIGWFSADNGGEGIEWGFIIDVPTLARILVTSLVFGAFFAVWSYRRGQVQASGLGLRAARPAGIAGAATSVLGLTTGSCTLAGCGGRTSWPVARAGIECEGLRRPTETHPRERIRREATSHVTSGAAEELRLGESDRVTLHV